MFAWKMFNDAVRARKGGRYSAGYSALADAIVLQAVQDWQLAMRKRGNAAKMRVTECERFFVGQWFTDLTNANGEDFLNRLKKWAEGNG